MKTTLPIIAAILLISCKDTRPIKSVCGCENVRVTVFEKEYGVLKGKEITFYDYMGLGRMSTDTARICNPEAIDSMRISHEKMKVLVSGDLFLDCDSSHATRKQMIHLREINLYHRE